MARADNSSPLLGAVTPPALGGSAARTTLPRHHTARAEISVADLTTCDLSDLSEMRAGLALDGSALHLAWHLRMSELGLPDELDLDQFRILWLEVLPGRASWRETEKMFREIDQDASGVVEFEEIMEYLQSEKQRRKAARPAPPGSARQILWVCVGTDPLDKTRRALGTGMPWLMRTVYCARSVRWVFTIAFIAVTIIGTLPATRSSTGEWGDDPTVFAVEATCVAYFLLDLLLFVVSFPHGPRALLKDPTLWVNAASVIPFLCSFMVSDAHLELSSVRVTRLGHRPLIRALRFIGMISPKHYSGVPKLTQLLAECWAPLLWLLILVLMFTIISGAFLYTFERHEAHFVDGKGWYRDVNSTLPDRGLRLEFQDMPDFMWWTLAAVCTGEQGYAEWVPKTGGGRWVGALCMLLSLVIISYPVTIVLDSLQREHRRAAEEEESKGLRGDLHHALRKYLGGAVVARHSSLRRPSTRPRHQSTVQINRVPKWADDLKSSVAACVGEVAALRQGFPTLTPGTPTTHRASLAASLGEHTVSHDDPDDGYVAVDDVPAQTKADLTSAVGHLVAVHGFGAVAAALLSHSGQLNQPPSISASRVTIPMAEQVCTLPDAQSRSPRVAPRRESRAVDPPAQQSPGNSPGQAQVMSPLAVGGPSFSLQRPPGSPLRPPSRTQPPSLPAAQRLPMPRGGSADGTGGRSGLTPPRRSSRTTTNAPSLSLSLRTPDPTPTAGEGLLMPPRVERSRSAPEL